MADKTSQVIYQYNIFMKGVCLVFSIFSFCFSYFIFKINVLDKVYGKLDFFAFVVLIISILLFVFLGIGCFVAPLNSRLILNKEGYTYKTMSFTLTAKWTESYFLNYLSFIFGKYGLLSPLSPNVYLNPLAKYLGDKDFSGGIPVNFFGDFSSQKLKENIQEMAPYLFGFLYSEEDFVSTIRALEDMIKNYQETGANPGLFCSQYNQFYERYISNGKEFVANSFNLMTKYSLRVAYLTSVWSEVTNREHFEDGVYDGIDKQQINKISERYFKNE